MGKRRPSGDGMVRKREDGRWEGRIVVGHKADGSSIFRYLYADTQKELTARLRQEIDAYQGVDLTEDSRMAVGEWLENRPEGMSDEEYDHLKTVWNDVQETMSQGNVNATLSAN